MCAGRVQYFCLHSDYNVAVIQYTNKFKYREGKYQGFQIYDFSQIKL